MDYYKLYVIRLRIDRTTASYWPYNSEVFTLSQNIFTQVYMYVHQEFYLFTRNIL